MDHTQKPSSKRFDKQQDTEIEMLHTTHQHTFCLVIGECFGRCWYSPKTGFLVGVLLQQMADRKPLFWEISSVVHHFTGRRKPFSLECIFESSPKCGYNTNMYMRKDWNWRDYTLLVGYLYTTQIAKRWYLAMPFCTTTAVPSYQRRLISKCSFLWAYTTMAIVLQTKRMWKSLKLHL